MNRAEALRIVYDLASQNALDLDHQDAELRAEASRQDDALDVVFDILKEHEAEDSSVSTFILQEVDGEPRLTPEE